MNNHIRKQLILKFATKLSLGSTSTLSYAHCRVLAKELDCDTNTVARLVALPNFKPTQSLKPELEQKIATYLGCKSYADLEIELMILVVLELLKKLLHTEK